MKSSICDRVLLFSSVSCCLLIQAQVHASGFQLVEENTSGLGTAHSGWAIDRDASSAYYNPAGITALTAPQVIVSNTLIHTQAKFIGDASISYTDLTIPLETPLIVETTSGQTGGTQKVIPAFYLAGPLNEKWSYGFGLSVPFGLETNWSDFSAVRYSATLSRLQVLDYHASVGYHPIPELSLGFGVDKQRLSAVFGQVVALPVDPGLLLATDTLTKNSGVSWGTGWHAGFIYEYDPNNIIGMSYRSEVSHRLLGKSESIALGSLATTSPTFNNTVSDTAMPAVIAMSYGHHFTDKWLLQVSAVHTKWSVFQDLRVQNANIIGSAVDITIHEGFHNTWGLSLGSEYRWSPQLTLRAGVATDNPPNDNRVRNIRLPDQQRYEVAMGGRWQITKSTALDAGYAHWFVRQAAINNTISVSLSPTDMENISVNGRVRGHADVLGLQLSVLFA